MALLRVINSLSTSTFNSSQQQHQFSLTSISSLQSSHSNLSLPFSFSSLSSPSHTHTHTPPFLQAQTNKKFPSTSQKQLLDTSLADASTETEEFSKTRLVAQNVPWSSTPEDIRAVFEKYGTVLDVELSMYNKTRNRGLAFVEMGSPEEALAALNNLESYELDGRILKVNYAKIKKKKPSPPVQPKPQGPKILRNSLIRGAVMLFLHRSYFMMLPESLQVMDLWPSNTKRMLMLPFLLSKERFLWGGQFRVARSRQFVKQPAEEKTESEVTPSESGAEQTDIAYGD